MAIKLSKTLKFSEKIEINSLAFSPDESRIVSGGFSHEMLSVRQLPGMGLAFKLALDYAGSPNDSVAWSSRNQIAALASNATEVRLWDGATGRLLRKIDCSDLGNLTSLAFDPTGAFLAVVGLNFGDPIDLLVLNLEHGTERRLDSRLDANRLSWIGESLVVAGGARTVDAPLALSVLAPDSHELALYLLSESSDRDAFVCPSSDPDVAAVFAWDNADMLTRVRLFDIKQRKELINEEFCEFDCEGAAYSRSTGQVVILVDDDSDCALQMLDDGLGTCEAFEVPGSSLNGGLAVAPSGKILAVASQDKVVIFSAAKDS